MGAAYYMPLEEGIKPMMLMDTSGFTQEIIIRVFPTRDNLY